MEKCNDKQNGGVMTEQTDILAFSPHPDDAELGCAGGLILASDNGLRTAVADLSNGDMSSVGNTARRNCEKEKSAEIMGLDRRFSLGLPDTEIGTDRNHLHTLVDLIRQTRPRIVLAPYLHDRHPDHRAASRLVRDACFFAGVRKLGSGDPHRPERVFYYMLHYLDRSFRPSFVLDISSVWDRKISAIEMYASQFHAPENCFKTALGTPEFIRFNQTKAAWFGAMIGTDFGEPYYTPGPLPLEGFPGLSFSSRSLGKMSHFSIF
jgi:bacillithiol biosynthesis deacetylase BshB1